MRSTSADSVIESPFSRPARPGRATIEGAAEVVRTGDALTTRPELAAEPLQVAERRGPVGIRCSEPARVARRARPGGRHVASLRPSACNLACPEAGLRCRAHDLAAAVGPSRRARSRPARLAVDRRAARRLDVRAASCAMALEGAAQAGRRAREEGRGQGERDDRRHRADRRGPERAPRRARRADHERLRPGGRARRERCRLVARSGTPFDRPHGPDRGGEEQCGPAGEGSAAAQAGVAGGGRPARGRLRGAVVHARA